MFLALDIGNSQVKAGLFDGRAWARTGRFPSDPAADWPVLLRAWAHETPVEAAGLAAVQPVIGDAVGAAVQSVFGIPPEAVNVQRSLPFRLAYQTPETLGADRLAAAAAAWLRFGHADDGRPRSVVALDAGTAVTTEVVTADGVYLGGAIAPGPDLLRRALARGTAQLPEIAWPEAPEPVGRSTREALAAGLSTLFLDGVRGLLTRTASALGAPPFVVATGGWAGWLARHLTEIQQVEPHLVLDGIRLLVSGAILHNP